MSVDEALKELSGAEAAICQARKRVRDAMESIESAVIEQLGEEGFTPCSEDDPVVVLCGDLLVTLVPDDDRPNVRVEPVSFVE